MSTLPALQRRALLQLTALVATTGLPPPAGAAEAGPSPGNAGSAAAVGPSQAQAVWARLNGDLSGRTVWFTTMGDVWGFRPQADDLTLDDFAQRGYGYAGLAARRMQRRDDGAIVVREKSWAFYRDPQSERLGDKITNLWTHAVDTAPPLSGPAREYVLSADATAGSPVEPHRMKIQRIGALAFVSTSSLARFRPRDATWFKLEANLTSHHCLASHLDDASRLHVPGTLVQNLVAEWQTWTGMHGQPGHILFKGDGAPLHRRADIPDELQRAIEDHFPGQLREVDGWK